jgi:hypothetical protein
MKKKSPLPLHNLLKSEGSGIIRKFADTFYVHYLLQMFNLLTLCFTQHPRLGKHMRPPTTIATGTSSLQGMAVLQTTQQH